MTPTLLALIGGLSASFLCFLIGGLTTYAGYKIFNKSHGNESSKLELKLWRMEAVVGNVGGVIMISGLAWGVIGYNVLPNLDYREENGSSSTVLTMTPSPVIFDSELNLSKPSEFMQSNADIFEEVKKELKEASHASKSADLSLVIEHEGKKDYSLDSFIDDYVHPIMDFCHPDEGTICNMQVRPEPGFDMADELTPFRPVKIKLYVQYR